MPGLPIKTDRVRLRRLAPDDLGAFQAYRCDPEVARFQSWEAMGDTQALEFIKDMLFDTLLQPGHWSQIAIAKLPEGGLIGDLGILVSDDSSEAEIGITLARMHQRQHFGREAYRAACDWVFAQTEVTKILGITDERNTASQHMLVAAGLTRTGTLVSEDGPETVTEFVYEIARSD